MELMELVENEEWVSVEDHLPPEHDSIFKKYKGTDKWCAGMFETISCDVIVSMTFGDGTKKTGAARTKDGQWKGLPEVGHPVVTHWMPFPKPYKEHETHADSGFQLLREKWGPCKCCGIAPFMDGVELKPCANGYMGVEAAVGKCRDDEAVGMVIYYKNAAAGYLDFAYCPFCGRPQTEEAWSKLENQLKAVKQIGACEHEEKPSSPAL